MYKVADSFAQQLAAERGLGGENKDLAVIDPEFESAGARPEKIPGTAAAGGEFDERAEGDHRGYNAATGEWVDMMKAGILDPAKVTRSALQNAASIAALVLTTESAVVEKPEEEEPAAAAGGHGHMH